ncbi:MAG: ABC transporter permease [Marinilabiliaceae bacterium]|nr:ABC transporter permease [Marinilabiliaceae bacterium]
MFYNFLIAFRNLYHNGIYSVINIIGLATALTVSILLALWIQDELSYDRFHKNGDKIYRINTYSPWSDFYFEGTPAPLAKAAATHPEVEAVCRTRNYRVGYFEYNSSKFFDFKCLAVDDSFFTIFSFQLIVGNTEKPFSDDFSLIISENKAKLLFGDENPIGKVIKTSNDFFLRVEGIVKDVPENSSIQFDFLVPHLLLQKTFGGNGPWKHIDDDWGNCDFHTYVVLNEKCDKDYLIYKLKEEENNSRKIAFASFFDNEDDEDDEDDDDEDDDDEEDGYLFQPIKKIHLYEADMSASNKLKNIYLLSIITFLLLLIACINYVNLSTSRAIKRSKEIAMRKVIGGKKISLFMQLIRETFLLLTCALIVATFLINFLIPVYNFITSKNLFFDFANPAVWLIYALMTFCVICLAGIYPAFSLILYSPLEAFRTAPDGRKKGSFLRKVLIVTQFIISFVLITVTITISRQIKYMNKKELGYEKENVFTFFSNNITPHFELFRDEMLKNNNVIDVTAGGFYRMMGGTNSRSDFHWQGKEDDIDPYIHYTYVESNFLDFMKITLIKGDHFSSIDSTYMIINEEAALLLGFENPIGQLIHFNKGDNNPFTIKGVVKNFHFEDLKNSKINPLFLIHAKNRNYANFIKVVPGGAKSAVETAETIWKRYHPDYDFNYRFLDENFAYFYKTELGMQRLLSIFALIAVFISCIGLFGLVTYTAESRTKELGIRKVFGAKFGDIVSRLSKEFLILVVIAMVIAIPVAYYWLSDMLKDYAYRIDITWKIFALSAIITITLTLLTIGWKAVATALRNPAKSIE